jgi:hypothetical protein
MRRRGSIATLALLASLAGCGTEGSSTAGSDQSPEARPPGTDVALTGPPPLTLHAPEGDVELPAYTWCIDSGCADGPAPENPPETRGAGPLTLSYPQPGWSFAADLRRPGRATGCDRTMHVTMDAADDGSLQLPAVGPAGRWQVDVTGYAEQGGDLLTTFLWSTPTDAAQLPVARGQVGLLGPPSLSQDQGLEGYGPSLYLTGLAAEPRNVSADVTLSDGVASATYPLHPVAKDPCPDDGAVSLEGEHPTEAVDLPELGEPPYTYDVRLVMDGEEYVGTGSWPEGLDPPNSNQVSLTWSPALPAWDGRRVR